MKPTDARLAEIQTVTSDYDHAIALSVDNNYVVVGVVNKGIYLEVKLPREALHVLMNYVFDQHKNHLATMQGMKS